MMILPCLFVAHYIAMNVKLVISQQLGTKVALDTTEQIRRKLELCQNYLEVYDKVSQGYTKWRGRLMEQLSSAEIKLGIRQFQEVSVQEKNSAIRDCPISARGAIKSHPFGTSAEQSGVCVLKGCNFISPLALIQQLYY